MTERLINIHKPIGFGEPNHDGQKKIGAQLTVMLPRDVYDMLVSFAARRKKKPDSELIRPLGPNAVTGETHPLYPVQRRRGMR